ncbi:DNA methyltransferase [Hallella faecis]|uniref:DNA methyltransferase n=1 Tax=Hallella faecis TaxID=2841596 RepID=UPI003F896B26
MLCDETLGNNNFLGMITRATGTTTGQDTGSLGKACDYILVYSKQDNYKIGGIPLSEKDLSRYSLKDKKGNFSILQLRRTGGEDRREDRPTMFFPIQAPDGSDVYPYGPTGYESRWRVGPQKVLQMLKDDLLYFKKDKNGNWKVYYKFYSDNKTKRPSNLWTEVDGNKKAQIELKNVVPDVKFETPKPLDLILKILQITSSKKSTVLDFFAGSGTTLHATMQLNAEDGGHRKCILVTNNENNICEEVTYERNKRVIQGYTTPKGEEVEGLHDNNLRYYRTTLLSRDKSVKNMRQLVRLATDMLCIKNDIYTEAPFCGKNINPNIARYFDNGQGNRMLVIYEERAIQLLVQLMAQTEDDGIKTMVYVFSPGADPYTDDFEDVAERVKLCALPSAIYEAYKRVLPKRKPKFLDEALQEMKAQAEAEANVQQTLDFGENDNMNEEGGEA